MRWRAPRQLWGCQGQGQEGWVREVATADLPNKHFTPYHTTQPQNHNYNTITSTTTTSERRRGVTSTGGENEGESRKELRG